LKLKDQLVFAGGKIDEAVNAFVIGHLGVNSAQHVWTGEFDGDSRKDGTLFIRDDTRNLTRESLRGGEAGCHKENQKNQ
jgi:hypothetical protein